MEETAGPYPDMTEMVGNKAFFRRDVTEGRAHIHVQVYVKGSVVKTTQIAFPESTTAEVYATGVYAAKGPNPTSNAGDNVFADGTQTEMAAVAGDPATGYSADLTISVSA